MDKERRKSFYHSPLPKQAEKFDFEWFETRSIPQSLQFMIDCLPRIRQLLADWPRTKVIEVLDVGAGSGAGAWLLAVLNRANQFGAPMKVDALDVCEGYKSYADEFFPDINYLVGDFFALDQSRTWDFIICSHTIEHFQDPRPLALELRRRARHWVMVYAPFDERDRVPSHRCSITPEFIESLNPLSVELIASPAWRKSQCVLFVLEGDGNR